MGGGGYDGSLVTGLHSIHAAAREHAPRRSSRASSRWAATAVTRALKASMAASAWTTKRSSNFGKQSVKKAHDAAMAVIQEGLRPSRPSVSTSSAVRRAATKRSTRRRAIPQDYDGVVANYPAYNVTMLAPGFVERGQRSIRQQRRGLDRREAHEAYRPTPSTRSATTSMA